VEDPRAYVRMALDLARAIDDDTLSPGDAVPSITDMCKKYGHARQTCARALRMLEESKFIVRIPGRGYYVTGPRD
jgi:DNA-binding GntR family transcriptional regulator